MRDDYLAGNSNVSHHGVRCFANQTANVLITRGCFAGYGYIFKRQISNRCVIGLTKQPTIAVRGGTCSRNIYIQVLDTVAVAIKCSAKEDFSVICISNGRPASPTIIATRSTATQVDIFSEADGLATKVHSCKAFNRSLARRRIVAIYQRRQACEFFWLADLKIGCIGVARVPVGIDALAVPSGLGLKRHRIKVLICALHRKGAAKGLVAAGLDLVAVVAIDKLIGALAFVCLACAAFLIPICIGDINLGIRRGHVQAQSVLCCRCKRDALLLAVCRRLELDTALRDVVVVLDLGLVGAVCGIVRQAQGVGCGVCSLVDRCFARLTRIARCSASTCDLDLSRRRGNLEGKGMLDRGELDFDIL